MRPVNPRQPPFSRVNLSTYCLCVKIPPAWADFHLPETKGKILLVVDQYLYESQLADEPKKRDNIFSPKKIRTNQIND